MNRHSRCVVEKLFGAPHIGAELDHVLLMDADMIVAVACKLMTFGHDFTNQPRMSFCYPPEDKKSSRYPSLCKKTKHLLGIHLDPTRQTIPLATINAAGESLHLEEILHIDGHCIANATNLCRRCAGVRLQTQIDSRSSCVAFADWHGPRSGGEAPVG